MKVKNSDLISWAGATRWRRIGIPYVVAIPRPIYEYPLSSGGYGENERPADPPAEEKK